MRGHESLSGERRKEIERIKGQRDLMRNSPSARIVRTWRGSKWMHWRKKMEMKQERERFSETNYGLWKLGLENTTSKQNKNSPVSTNSLFSLFQRRWRGSHCFYSDLPCFACSCCFPACSKTVVSERGKYPLERRWPLSTFHRWLCFIVNQFTNNILAKLKLFLLGCNINKSLTFATSFKAIGKRKIQKYSYEYLKVEQINSPDMLQFHLVPSGKIVSIHLSKELLCWHLLVLVSCWLEGEGDNVQETSMLEGSRCVLWDLGLLAVLSSFTVAACTCKFSTESVSCVSSFPCSLIREGRRHGEKCEQRMV